MELVTHTEVVNINSKNYIVLTVIVSLWFRMTARSLHNFKKCGIFIRRDGIHPKQDGWNRSSVPKGP